jgi:hypothetical protein
MKKSSLYILVALAAIMAVICFAENAQFSQGVFDVHEASFPEDNILPTFMFSQGMFMAIRISLPTCKPPPTPSFPH